LVVKGARRRTAENFERIYAARKNLEEK